MQPARAHSGTSTTGFVENSAACVSSNANAPKPSPTSLRSTGCRRAVHGRWRSRARDGGVDPAVRRPMKPCHCSGLRSWGSSASKPITPRYKLLETAVYDEYARWCERGRPRGIPLLDCELSETAFADARKKG